MQKRARLTQQERKQRPDPRALESRTYAQLARQYPHYIRALHWLESCRILARADLEQIMWPAVVSRQRRYHGIKKLIDTELIESIDEQDTAFQLGKHGVKLLARDGKSLSYRPAPSERVLPGLLLAGTFAASLGTMLMADPYALALQWQSQPFVGKTLRPDGTGTLVWAHQPQRRDLYPDILQPPDSGKVDAQSIHIMLEIDRCSERAMALDERRRAWRKALHEPTLSNLAEHDSIVVLWVTTGTRRRAQTLCAMWKSLPIPAFFTTTYELREQQSTGYMRPFQTHWFDSKGQEVEGWQVFGRP